MIIAGDSYSTGGQCAHPSSWTQHIRQLNDCTIILERGYSNFDILQRLEDHSPQRAIISLTHLHRVPNKDRNDGKRNAAVTKLNIKAANHIVNTWTDAYIWSSFPHYEDWPGIHYMPLYKENELWDPDTGLVGEFADHDAQRYVAHHLTHEGNIQLFNCIVNTKGKSWVQD